MSPRVAGIFLVLMLVSPCVGAAETPVRVTESDEAVQIATDSLEASVRKKGYVSGIAAQSFLDRKTGARDLGFGLHIQDFLLAPGWRDDGYERNPKFHGNLPKHYVEKPQICTQARQLPIEIIRGDTFVALKTKFTYTQAGEGLKAGSVWTQTLVFQPGVRYVISSETITSANDADDMFYRIDMPGHIKHKGADTFEQVYLSYREKPFIPAAEFSSAFGPDEKFLYQRDDNHIPERIIRGYQVKLDGKPGPWLVGMTLDPAEAAEGWCHERGYVCFIEELHRKHVKAGETFGAAYIVGWFDDVKEMERVYDQYRGRKSIVIEGGKFRVE